MSRYRNALLNMVNDDAPESVNVPAKFVDDFEAVAVHYGLHETGEYLEAKDAARSDLDSAITTFAAMADEIRRGNA